MTTYIALLRGINVGGNNKVPMKDLSAVFQSVGCVEVRTYIQSGNVVFACARVESELRVELETRIRERFGFAVPVVLRSAEELRPVPGANPFPEAESGVMFLADPPTPEGVAKLDPNRSPGDSFVVHGREVYLHLPNGFANTKFTNAYLDSKLSTVSTGRNLRTVAKLIEMAHEIDTIEKVHPCP